jgi:hypothetical protein
MAALLLNDPDLRSDRYARLADLYVIEEEL